MDSAFITLACLEAGQALASGRAEAQKDMTLDAQEAYRQSLHMGSCSLLEWLQQFRGVDAVSPLEFYADLFSRRDLELSTDLEPTGKYCGLVSEIDLTAKDHWQTFYTSARAALPDSPTSIPEARSQAYAAIREQGEWISHTHFITQDFSFLENDVLTSKNFCLCSPLSYAGRHRTKEAARFCYAICIEVDKLKVSKTGEQTGMENLAYQIYNGFLPVPSYVVWSGNGLHLYFVLDVPIAMYRTNATALNHIHRLLTKLLWNSYITDLYKEQDIQYESIYQGFRVPGTRTKKGLATNTDELAQAFRYGLGESVSLEYLVSFLNQKQVQEAWKDLESKSKGYNLREMCVAYGEDWVTRHFDMATGQPLQHPIRKKWYVKRAFYDSFRAKVINETQEGHRYKSLKMLIAAGDKCGIPWDELEADIEAVGRILMGKKADNPFNLTDIMDALSVRNDPKLITYTSDYMTASAGVTPYEHARRNGRKQALHLRGARAIQEINDPEGKWREGSGRKPKRDEVRHWREAHPAGTKADCIKDTGLSKPTVYKWWPK